jgi:hypothetical protein
MSIDAENGMELTEVPPEMTPTLNVVFGDVGTWTAAMSAIALPHA